MVELRPYQKEGATWLAGKTAALLGDEMGVGKTAQAIIAAREVRDTMAEFSMLVVCPASVVENWKREIEMFWPESDEYGVYIEVVSYNKAATKDYAHASYDLLVLDEAHYLKSPTALRTKAIFGCDDPDERIEGLIERCDRVYALTGTPMPNNPGELYPLLKALAPEAIVNPKSGRVYSYWQYVNKYCKTRNNGFGLQIVGAKNADKLSAALKTFMLRRVKSEVAKELPALDFTQIYVEGSIPRGHDAEIEAVRRALEKDGVDGLKKVATHVATLRRLTGIAKAKPCAEWIEDWLESCDRKLVVFAWHADVIADIVKRLSGTVALVTGSTGQKRRQREVDTFQHDPACRVFIGQIQAAGVGITLTAASDVLFAESSWVPSDNAQAAARVHRIGQEMPCLARFATLSGSIDDNITAAVRRKAADISAILEE